MFLFLFVLIRFDYFIKKKYFFSELREKNLLLFSCLPKNNKSSMKTVLYVISQ